MASRKPLTVLTKNQGELPAGDDLLLSAVNAAGARFSNGTYGVAHYMDSGAYYLLLTPAGSPLSASYNALRPFSVNLSTGLVSHGNGLSVSGGLGADKATVSGLFDASYVKAAGPLSAAQWQAQGGYSGWNYEGASGATNFINSRGGGLGGFTFYNADSAANSTPTLLMSLSGAGVLSLPLAPLPLASGGTNATTPAAALANLGAYAASNPSNYQTAANVTATVNTAIANLVNAAPAALDTLGEIANQLAADESAASALTTTVAGKVSKTGDTMAGVLKMTAAGTQIRHTSGNYSLLQYADGSNFYLLLTNSGDQDGSFNGLRPFSVNLASGFVTMQNGAAVYGGLTTDVSTVNSAGQARRLFSSTSGATDQKISDTLTDGTNWLFRLLNDAQTAANTWLQVVRSGYTAASITLTAAVISLAGLARAGRLGVGGGANGGLTAADWATQGGYVGWAVPGARFAGSTVFVNSKGLGSGGFEFFNAPSSAGSALTKLADLGPDGTWTFAAPLPVASGGTNATTQAAALANLGAVAATGGTATGLSQDYLNLNGNFGNFIPGGLAGITWNYSSGGREVSFFNGDTLSANTAFAWHQKLTGTTTRLLMSLSATGVPGFAQPVPITSGGHGANTAAQGLANLGGFSTAGGIVTGAVTVQNTLSAYVLEAYATPVAAQWQLQGGYMGWNYSNGGGETDFINSRGSGSGGFRWYDTASAANSVPNLLATLDPAGNLALAGGAAATDLNIAGTGGVAGAWTSAAAAVVANSGSGFSATGAVRYKKFGRTVFINVDVQISTSGGGAGSVNVALPFANNASMQSYISGRELASSGLALNGYIAPGSATLIVTNYNNTFPGAMMGASRLSLCGVYEASA